MKYIEVILRDPSPQHNDLGIAIPSFGELITTQQLIGSFKLLLKSLTSSTDSDGQEIPKSFTGYTVEVDLKDTI